MSSAEPNLITRLRLLPVVLGVGAALLVSGCGAGQIAQTDTQVPAVNGSMGTVKQIDVRDAQLAFPLPNGYYQRGDTAALLVTIANSGDTTDTLSDITSPAFGSVQLRGSASIPSHDAIRAGGSTAQPVSTTSVAPTSSSTPPSSATATPTSSAQGLPAGTVRIQLMGMTLDKLRPGQTVQITFTFANSGDVTLNVPIANDPRPRD